MGVIRITAPLEELSCDVVVHVLNDSPTDSSWLPAGTGSPMVSHESSSLMLPCPGTLITMGGPRFEPVAIWVAGGKLIGAAAVPNMLYRLLALGGSVTLIAAVDSKVVTATLKVLGGRTVYRG